MHKILIPIFLLLFTTLSTSSSDLPVPRWVSLKGDANLRKGPFPEATIIYRYQLKGYPMEIIRDIEGWRQVRGPKDELGADEERQRRLCRLVLLLLDCELVVPLSLIHI